MDTTYHPEKLLHDERKMLRDARRKDHIARIVAAAPPLTPEQIERLRILLASGQERRS